MADANTICPVCGNSVPADHPPIGLRRLRGSRTELVPLWLCGRGCAEQAQRDPERYIEAAAQNAMAEPAQF